jgi:hypothetical protein
LIEGIDAQYLLADKGHDSGAIVKQARRQGMQAVIAPGKNPGSYDKHLYKCRHLVENAFLHLKLHLKRWRGYCHAVCQERGLILTVVQIRRLALWLNIS